jgi:hypothetical protein
MATNPAADPEFRRRLCAQSGQRDRPCDCAAGVCGRRGPVTGRRDGAVGRESRSCAGDHDRGVGGGLPLQPGDVLSDPLGPRRRQAIAAGRLAAAKADRRSGRHGVAAGRSGIGGGLDRVGTTHGDRPSRPSDHRDADVRGDLHGDRCAHRRGDQQSGQRSSDNPARLDGRRVLRPRRQRRRRGVVTFLPNAFRHTMDGRSAFAPCRPAWRSGHRSDLGGRRGRQPRAHCLS